jgi:hypothetical protein
MCSEWEFPTTGKQPTYSTQCRYSSTGSYMITFTGEPAA